MKRIVAIAMAVIMIVATSMTALADSVKVALLKLSCEQTFTVSETDQTASIDLEFTYETADGQKTTVDAPHNFITLTSDTVVLKDVVIKSVNGNGTEYYDKETDIVDSIDTNPWPASIDADGKDISSGKILLETEVGESRKTDFESIVLTATYTIPANTAKGEYTITATADATDYTEADYADVTADYTLVVAEKVVEPECDHANATLEYDVVDGNCITTKVCPDCDAEPEIIATIENTITDVKQSIVLAEGLAINFRTVASAVSEYTSIYGEFKKDVYSGNTVTGTSDSTVSAKEETVSKVLYQTCKYEGIASYEMTSNIHLSLYGTDANGNVVLLRDLDYKFVDYLDNQYSKLTGIYRNVLGRLADYGTYIQLMNSYHTDHVPNDSMPDDLAIELPTTFTNTEVTETGIKINSTPKVGNTLTVNYRILKTDVTNYDDFSLTISYVDAYNASQTVTVSLSAGDFTTYTSGGKEYWSYEFKGLVAAKINEINEAVLKDSAGKEIGYLSSGLPSYLKKNYDSYNASTTTYYYNFAKVCQAITAYGDAVAALY